MATYFNGNSDIQADGLQTLILMNPGYVGYSDTQTPPPPNFTNLPHAPPNHTTQLVGIPLTAATFSSSASASASSHGPHPPSVHTQHDFSAFHGLIPRVHYNLYNSIDHTTEARDVSRAKQELSLSLSSQQPQYGSYRAEREGPSQANLPTISPTSGNNVRVSDGLGSSASGISNGASGTQSGVLGSKYLKVAQELLDEVVRVDEALNNESAAKGTATGLTMRTGKPSASETTAGGGATNSKGSAELTTAERQEIQMKKAKLVNMLDEVEQRYRQYHHQMHIVITWFEQVSGIGSGKTYTALALKTISKQFRCLKDSITSQIRAVSKCLGEEDCFGGGKIEGSRLKFVDHQLRQQRALQQLGMIQHNAWRPQRGLPERSVSVLRAWLFEHFLHPYPKDSDKLLLAKQTGLTRSQVSNWFINARVRLWKPMVEEMYTEEVKVQEEQQNGSEDKTSKSEANGDSALNSIAFQEIENQNKSFMSKQDNAKNKKTNNVSSISISTASTSSPTGVNIRNQTGRLPLIGASEMEQGIAQASPKRHRNIEMLQSPQNSGSSMDDQVSMKFGNERQSRESFSLMGAPTNLIGGFGSYQIGEMTRFSADRLPSAYSGNAVSLSLGLPHCDNLSMSGTHQSYLPNQNIQLGRGEEIREPNEFGTINSPTSSHSTAIYESINIQNRKRFAAAQLLPDFVAL
ncbi:BEL1-like homeodomain protein 1 [Cornus florida]|uniref:BEL1-like homeodomain protein 1 n=1 Tax=Cornus florida TaxID=4283 RepID=UPI0028A2C324|nr:BEL1-like homeodomain protein 1 [Cornus florida]XP_059668652.1 BEL1-like homeodomain protein 1 [Cornus florida]